MYSEKKGSSKRSEDRESKPGHLVDEQKTNYKKSRYSNDGKNIVENYKEPGLKNNRYK